MITQIFNKDILKILTIFSMSPGSKFVRRELQEKTRMTNVNLDNALNILLNSTIITKEKRFLALNLNEVTKQIINLILKQYKQLKELPLNVYFSIIDIINPLSKFKDIDIYLFGSFAKLVFKETSDIDLAIISEGLSKKEINRLISKIEARYNKNIQVHYFSKDFYKNKKDPIVREILRNGVRLL